MVLSKMKSKTSVQGGMRQFLRCRPGQEERLVRLEDVVECIPMVAIEEAQSATNPNYRGLLHFRGRVVPVFEVDGGGGEALDIGWFLLILRSGEQEVALVARDVFEIMSCPAADYRRVAIGRESYQTVVSTESRVYQVVEPDELSRG